jgi:hypothetical protein
MFTRNHRPLKALSVASVLLLAVFFVPGLSIASIGKVQSSKAASEDFEAHRFDSNYRYYALTNGGIPYAILGLQKEYRFHDISWEEINTDSVQLQHLIDLVHFFPVQGYSVASGSLILDSHGMKIGTFYSSLNVGITVNNEDKTILVSTDNSWLGAGS